MNEEHSFPNSEVYINNSGLVLLQPYFSTLFERLELTKENNFINQDAQLKAVHYLQFLVTGQSQTEEEFLVLNKILCGLEINTPIPNGIDISTEEVRLMEGLLEAVIQNWSILGNQSIEGFRGSFLIREGKLIENENSWNLLVEQKSYDMLIDQLPYSYTPIKISWMEKMVEVNWR